MHDTLNQFGAQTNPSAQFGFGREGQNASAPKLVQPADPLTDRIQKALAESNAIICEAESDLDSVSRRLFGECPGRGGGGEPADKPNGADEAIAQALSVVIAAAVRVRQLAAELNGRI